MVVQVELGADFVQVFFTSEKCLLFNWYHVVHFFFVLMDEDRVVFSVDIVLS